MSSGMRNVARAGVVTAVTLLSVLGLTSTALAATSNASGVGASARAEWSWVGRNQINVTRRQADDTACDANSVYFKIRLDVSFSEDVARLDNSLGCNHVEIDLQAHRYMGAGDIRSARVVACVNDAGPDTCYAGNVVDNPNT